jgi:hypothetical protein
MKTRHSSLCAWFLFALAAFAPVLFAQQMNYQGRLTDASGNPLQDGQYTLTFELFDGPVNGARVWGPFLYDGGSGAGHGPKADLVNGRFNVILGPNDTNAPARPLSGAFSGPRYLQITVASNPPLLPRQQILSAPDALHAINADHATLADGISGNLNVTGVFTVGGNSTFGGTISAPSGFTGDVSVSGNVSVGGALNVPGPANFGPSFRQMLNLSGVQYGIGVQTGTEYFRSATGFAWYRGGVHAVGANDAGAGGKSLMTFDGNGLYVYGEGYATATFLPLSTKGSRGSHIHYGANGDWYIRSASASGNVYIQDSSVGGGTTTFGGNVGIGGSADFPLHVSSKRNFNFNQGVGDLRNYSGGVYQHQSGPDDYSIVSDGFVWAPSFQATSDQRIKSIDGASNTAKDLETVQKLKVTDYHYIDTTSNGGRAQKGFIAQEVQQVIPEAVSSGPGYIPNIFALASEVNFDADKKLLTITVSKAHELKTADKVRLICENGGTKELMVESVVSDNTFVVAKCEKNPGRVFVHGKQIPDLLNLNYDRIFSTGIGAIQELTRRVKELEERQQRFADLEKKARRVETLEEELSSLRKVVTQLARAQRLETDGALAVK